MTNPAEIENHDRMQRVLPRRAEHAVVDKLHEPKKDDDRRNERHQEALPVKPRRPDDVGCKDRRRDQRVGPEQHAKHT